MIRSLWLRLLTAAGPALFLPLPVLAAGDADPGTITVHKRSRVAAGGNIAVREAVERWDAKQTAVIVCDMWDAHHCLNAVRRAEEMAPRMDRALQAARDRGALVIHAPSSCMDAYKDHPGRKRAQAAPK